MVAKIEQLIITMTGFNSFRISSAIALFSMHVSFRMEIVIKLNKFTLSQGKQVRFHQ